MTAAYAINNSAPFTIWFKVVPARGTSRFSYLRDLQNLATKVYNALMAANNVNLAIPGGGPNETSDRLLDQPALYQYVPGAINEVTGQPNSLDDVTSILEQAPGSPYGTPETGETTSASLTTATLPTTGTVGAASCAAVPQIGNMPALLMLEGFYQVPASVSANPCAMPTSDTYIFCKNEAISGPLGPQPWLGPAGQPTTQTDNEVVNLLNTLLPQLSSILDASGATPQVFRLSYKNITYGDRGFTFPLGVAQP